MPLLCVDWSQPSLLSVVYPVSLFCFALLVNPRPPTLYWQLLIAYTAVLIFFRFLFQYPLFALCTSLTSSPYYTTRSDLSDPYCNAVVSYTSDGSLVQNIAGLLKVTSRNNAESGWLWTFMAGTAVDFVTLFVLLIHRKALKDDGLWYRPLLLTPEEEEEVREARRRKRMAELRKLKERRAKAHQARVEARKKRRVQEERVRRKDVLMLARLLHKRQMTEQEEVEKRQLEQRILEGNIRQRRKFHPAPLQLTETKEEAETTGRIHRLSSANSSQLNSIRELEEALRADQDDDEEEEERETKEAADLTAEAARSAGLTDSDVEPPPHAHNRRGSLRRRVGHRPHDAHIHGDDGKHHRLRHEPHAGSHGTQVSGPSHHQKGKRGAAEDEEEPSFPVWLYRTLNDGSKKTGADFYLATFVLQVVLFIVVLCFYNTQSNIYESAQNNYIPLQFVLVILSIFILIALERVVYLYQSLFLKLALQLSTLITFFVISIVLGLEYSALLQVCYVIFAIYWTLSALQYYWGYPLNTQGKALMRSTNIWSSTALTIYRAIPFVFELQNLLDWSCIRTTLNFGEWLILEDVLANFYSVQCNTDGMRNSPSTEGNAVGKVTKWLVGVLLFLLLVLLLFGPLFLFSSRVATQPDSVTSLTTRIELNGFSPLFSSDQFASVELTADQWQTAVNSNPGLLTSQDYDTLQVLYPQNTGNGVWQITPGGRSILLDALNTTTVVLNVTLIFTRSSLADAPVVYTEYSRPLAASESAALIQAVESGDPAYGTVSLPSCYPRYLSLSSTSSSITDSVEVLSSNPGDLNTCSLVYHTPNGTDPAWWEVLDGGAANGTLGEVSAVDAPPLFVFSQRIPSSTALNLGLVAIYVTVVLAIGLKVRGFVQGNSANLIYQQVPDPAVVLTLCKDLYSARLLGQLVLEEQLYVALINLLRSPEQLLQETGQYVHFYPQSPSPPPSPVDNDDDGDEDDKERKGSDAIDEQEKKEGTFTDVRAR